jgi:hypothetical protein
VLAIPIAPTACHYDQIEISGPWTCGYHLKTLSKIVTGAHNKVTSDTGPDVDGPDVDGPM